jgi:hypothetical protein
MGAMALTAVSPALPLHEAGKYVAGAYIVLIAMILVYVAIMAVRLSRIERDLGELLEVAEHDGGQASATTETAIDTERESTPA